MEKAKVGAIVDLVFKGVALAMAVSSVVLGFLGAAPTETQVTLLGIGLFGLALVALQETDEV